MRKRVMFEVDAPSLPDDDDDWQDAMTDRLIQAFDTPDIEILDIVEEGEPAWHRTKRF